MKKNPFTNSFLYNRISILAFLILVFVVNVIFTITIIRTQASEIETLEGSINDLRKKEGSYSKHGKERTTDDIAAFMKRVPMEGRLTSIIRSVFDAARHNGLAIPAGEYSPQTIKDGDVSRYVMTFPVEGSYPRIKKFIYDVEMLRQMIAIEEITLKGGRVDSETIRLNIKIAVYYR